MHNTLLSDILILRCIAFINAHRRASGLINRAITVPNLPKLFIQ